MGTVVGITAKLQAKNGMTPHLEDVVKVTRQAVKEMLGLDDATQEMIKEMRKMKQAAEQSARGFNREIDQMQREIQDLKRQLGGLDSTRATPKVTIEDQARREIEAIRQEIQALNAEKAKIQVEAANAGGGFTAGGMIGAASAYLGAGYIDRLTLETQANARRALLGDTSEELAQYQRQAQELSLINPNIDRTYVKDLMTQATRFDGANGTELTKQALQLSAIRPDMGGADEFLNTQMLMKNAMPDADINRIGDSLGYVALKARDIRKDTLDSLQEYSAQMTKFIDSPEKLAMLVEAMNDVWNTDTGFDTLKEVGLKLNNVGDLENVLKTAYGAQGMSDDKASELAKKEAEQIGKYLASGSKQDRQYATGVLMQTFASIKDEFVRQNLLNELAAGPGENAGQEELVKLLQKAGEIAVIDPMVYREKMMGQLDSLYQTFQQNDPLHDFIKAKTMLSNELISLGAVIAEDLEPTMRWAADAVKKFKSFLDELPTGAAVAVLGTGLIATTASLYMFKKAIEGVGDRIRRSVGGDMPDIDLPDGPDKKKRGGGGGSKKRKWYNPLSWAGGKQDPPPKKNWLTSQEAADMAFGKNAPREVPTKTNWLTSTLKSVGGVLPSGDTAMKGIKSAWEGVKSVGGGLTKRLPIIGLAVGAGEILQSDNKLETAARLGTETLGGWGGAAAGAAIGSVVPGIGTAIGGIVGAIAGSFGGSALFEGIKKDLEKQVLVQDPRRLPSQETMAEIRKTMPKPPIYGPPVPAVSPVAKTNEKPKVVSLSVQSVPITLQADGVLQDVPTMLRLLDNPSVSQKVKDIIEKALIDALETQGGVVM